MASYSSNENFNSPVYKSGRVVVTASLDVDLAQAHKPNTIEVPTHVLLMVRKTKIAGRTNANRANTFPVTSNWEHCKTHSGGTVKKDDWDFGGVACGSQSFNPAKDRMATYWSNIPQVAAQLGGMASILNTSGGEIKPGDAVYINFSSTGYDNRQGFQQLTGAGMDSSTNWKLVPITTTLTGNIMIGHAASFAEAHRPFDIRLGSYIA